MRTTRAIILALGAAAWATVAAAELTLNLQGDNINDDRNGAVAVIDVVSDGSATNNTTDYEFLNYPGTGGTAPAISGSVSNAYAGSTFKVRINPCQFDADTNSATFAFNTGNARTTQASSGLGVSLPPAGSGIGALAASNQYEGVAFSLGTFDLLPQSRLKVTAITLSNFDEASGESVYVVNNMTGAFEQYDSTNLVSGGVRVATIDLTALDIVVDVGQALPAFGASTTGDQTFSLVTAAEASDGFRIESIALDIVPGDVEPPPPATDGIVIATRGSNVDDERFNSIAGVFNIGGTWLRDSTTSVNFPGTDSTYPAVSGGVDAALSNAAFQIRMDPGIFENVAASNNFGYRINNRRTAGGDEAGLGVKFGSAGAGIGGTYENGFEGVAFNIGTENTANFTDFKLVVTEVELNNFEVGSNYVESAIILNNQSGVYTNIYATETTNNVVIDVSSLGIEITGGVHLVDDAGTNAVGGADFTLMFGTTEVTNSGFRLASVKVDLVSTIYQHPFDVWAADYELQFGETGDDDGDGLANLYEYAVGGNPTNPADKGYDVGIGSASGGGSNWVEYLYARLTDPDSGISYMVVKKENLVFDTVWTNATAVETGADDLGNGYEMVTNQISVEADAKFISLEVNRVD
jgi:hypothetical protein